MRFQMPESLDGLSLAEITALHADALAEASELNAIDDDKITEAEVDDLMALADSLALLAQRQVELETAAQERADKLAAARGRVAEASVPADDPDAEEDEDEEGDSDDDDGDEPAEESEDAEAEQELEPVAASAGARKGIVRRAASRAPKPQDVAPPKPAGGVLIASANVPEFTAGVELNGMDDLVKAFMARSRMLIGRKDKASMERYGVATIQRPVDEFTITSKMSSAEQMDVITAASKETRLQGGSLLAAGGWCAPSETLYTFCENETAEGLYDLPSVTITHGGLNFTRGPQLGDLLANPDFGFIQTEAQAEAGTPKVCFEFECPDFTDHRLDAFGYCFRAPILTASPAGWPELIRRFLNLSTIGWQYKMASEKLNRVRTALGTAVDFTEIGSVSADILDAVSLQAMIQRQQQFLSPTATIEVVLPIWAKEIFRADLARRSGQALLAIPDSQIEQGFSVRHLSVQWINGYQPLSTGAGVGTAYPTTLEALVYPAGTFVWGNNSVINLDTVYDHASLEVNMYTAVFFEEAGMLFSPCGDGTKVSIDISCLKGVTGANELSCIPVGP